MQNNCGSWKDAYMEQKNDIGKMRNFFVYNFNPSNNSNIEWENLFLNEIIDNASNPH